MDKKKHHIAEDKLSQEAKQKTTEPDNTTDNTTAQESEEIEDTPQTETEPKQTDQDERRIR